MSQHTTSYTAREASTLANKDTKHAKDTLDSSVGAQYNEQGQLISLQPQRPPGMWYCDFFDAVNRAADVPMSPDGIELTLNGKGNHLDDSRSVLDTLLAKGSKISRLTWSVDPYSLAIPWERSVISMLNCTVDGVTYRSPPALTPPEDRPRVTTISLSKRFERSEYEGSRHDELDRGVFKWASIVDSAIDPVTRGKAIGLKFLPDSEFLGPDPSASVQFQYSNDNVRVISSSNGNNVLPNQRTTGSATSRPLAILTAGNRNGPQVIGDRQTTMESLALRVIEARDITVVFEGMADACFQTAVKPDELKMFWEQLNDEVDGWLSKNPTLLEHSTRTGATCFISKDKETTETLLDALGRGLDCKDVSWDCQFDPALIPGGMGEVSGQSVSDGDGDGEWVAVEKEEL